MRYDFGVLVVEGPSVIRFIPEQMQFSVTVESGDKIAEFRYTPEQFMQTRREGVQAWAEFVKFTARK